MPLSDDDLRQAIDAGLSDDEIAQLDAESHGESDVPSLPDASVLDSVPYTSLSEAVHEGVGKPILGIAATADAGIKSVAEGALSMAGGFVPGVVNSLGTIRHGAAMRADQLINKVTGRPMSEDHLADPSYEINQHRSWYTPKTEVGMLIPEKIAGTAEALKNKTKSLLEQHGHPALAQEVDPAFSALGDALNVVGAKGFAKGALSDVGKSAIKRDAEKQSYLNEIKSVDEKIIKSFQDGQKHGLVAVPAEIPHSQTGRGWQSAGGKTLSEADASVHNADKMHEVFAKENGFEKNQPIMNDDITKRVDDEIASGYDPVTKNLVAINFDKQYFNDLKKIGELESKASAPKRGPTKTPVIDLVNEYSDVHPFMDGDEAVAMIKELRAKSSDLYEAGGNKQLAKSHKEIANAIEDLIERHAPPEMIHDFRESRRNIAKLETMREVIDYASGKVDPSKVAQLDVQSGRLTGRTREMAVFARNFPKSTANPHVSLARQNMSTTSHLTGGVLGAAKGEGALSEMLGAISGAVGLSKARELMRKHILSKGYQEKLVPDYKQPPSLLSKLPTQESPMNPAYALPGFLNSTEDQQQ